MTEHRTGSRTESGLAVEFPVVGRFRTPSPATPPSGMLHLAEVEVAVATGYRSDGGISAMLDAKLL